jgi:hypothetical protein
MADKTLILFDAAFKLLEAELKALPQAPRDLESFIERLVSPVYVDPKKQTEPAMAPERYVSLAEFAAILGVCRKSAEGWARRGRIPRIMAGRKVRIPLGAALEALGNNRQPGSHP